MDEKTKEIEMVRLLGESVYQVAEQAAEVYEQGTRYYQRKELRKMLDRKYLDHALVIAKRFLRAAQQRDKQHLRALLNALFEAWEERRRLRRRRTALPSVMALGASALEFILRQKKAIELLDFLAVEIMAIAFELIFKRDGDPGGTAAYLVNTVPEMRPRPCPIEEYQDDIEPEEDEEGER